jgi:hypothetical protein
VITRVGRKVQWLLPVSKFFKPSSVAKSAPRRKTGAKTWIPNRSTTQDGFGG